MTALITPEELPKWVPGTLTVDSAAQGWQGIRLRGYRYAASDVPVPAMQDFMIVVYKHGATPMNRRCTRDWQAEQVLPGAVSVLTNAVPSHWRWSEDIEVLHLYLSLAALANVAADVYEREIGVVELRDVLKAEDPVLQNIAAALEAETHAGGLGGRVYVESLRLQGCIQLLRRYAEVSMAPPASSGTLNGRQKRLLIDYVQETLDRQISLEDMAAQVDLSVFHFSRKFRACFNLPPHAWLLRQRVIRAQDLLARSDLPLKVVAADAGFADQSHMTRIFRRTTGTTPAEYRTIRAGRQPSEDA